MINDTLGLFSDMDLNWSDFDSELLLEYKKLLKEKEEILKETQKKIYRICNQEKVRNEQDLDCFPILLLDQSYGSIADLVMAQYTLREKRNIIEECEDLREVLSELQSVWDDIQKQVRTKYKILDLSVPDAFDEFFPCTVRGMTYASFLEIKDEIEYLSDFIKRLES